MLLGRRRGREDERRETKAQHFVPSLTSFERPSSIFTIPSFLTDYILPLDDPETSSSAKTSPSKSIDYKDIIDERAEEARLWKERMREKTEEELAKSRQQLVPPKGLRAADREFKHFTSDFCCLHVDGVEDPMQGRVENRTLVELVPFSLLLTSFPSF